MSESDAIDPAMTRLLVEQIETVAQIEALLLLHKRRPSPQLAQDIAAELRIDPAGAGKQLDALVGRGLLLRTPDDMYALNDQNEELMVLLPQLAQLYAARRVTVITLVYSPQTTAAATAAASAPAPESAVSPAVQQFADAFRLRRPDHGKQRDSPKQSPDQPGEKDV